MKHPIQHTYIDEQGTRRFRKNAIVRFLLDAGPIDMNKLAVMEFSDADRVQFAQLIGYSLSGFSDLSYVSDDDYNVAKAMADDAMLTEERARIQYLEQQLETVRASLRALVPQLFNIHPDDLAS